MNAKLNNLPNGLLTQTIHAMDDWCDYLTEDRLFELDEDKLSIVFSHISKIDFFKLGQYAERTGEFNWSDKYFATNYNLDKIWSVAEDESDQYYKERGYDWENILDRLLELYSNHSFFRATLPDEVKNILDKHGV